MNFFTIASTVFKPPSSTFETWPLYHHANVCLFHRYLWFVLTLISISIFVELLLVVQTEHHDFVVSFQRATSWRSRRTSGGPPCSATGTPRSRPTAQWHCTPWRGCSRRQCCRCQPVTRLYFYSSNMWLYKTGFRLVLRFLFRLMCVFLEGFYLGTF